MTIFIQTIFWISFISLIITLLCAKFNLISKVKKICEKQEKRLTGLAIVVLAPLVLGFLIAELVNDFKKNVITFKYRDFYLPPFTAILLIHHYNGLYMLLTNKDISRTYHNNTTQQKIIEYGNCIITFTPK